MVFAVMLGYALGYSLSALIPVWGPRWGLVAAGLLESSEQKLQGYWVTRFIHAIMYGGIAHKGAAMPSMHSSTAAVFLFWCSRCGGLREVSLRALLLLAWVWGPITVAIIMLPALFVELPWGHSASGSLIS